MATMRAWQYLGSGEPLALQHVEVPRPAGGEVLVELRAAGLCHTDVGILDGALASLIPRTPMTLGHEVAGVVTELGDDVTGYGVGDRVSSLQGLDSPGIGRNGAYAEYVTIPQEKLVPIPDGVSFEQAAVGSDAGVTAYHAVVILGRASTGDRIGIIGAGGVGMVGLQLAVRAGAEVFVAEPRESARQRAREFGASECVVDAADLAPFSPSLIVDFAGFGSTTAAAVAAVAPYGRVIVVGLGRSEATIDTTSLITKRVSVWGSGADRDENVAEVYDILREGGIDLSLAPIPFDEIGAGIERLRAGDAEGRLVARIGQQ